MKNDPVPNGRPRLILHHRVVLGWPILFILLLFPPPLPPLLSSPCKRRLAGRWSCRRCMIRTLVKAAPAVFCAPGSIRTLPSRSMECSTRVQGGGKGTPGRAGRGGGLYFRSVAHSPIVISLCLPACLPTSQPASHASACPAHPQLRARAFR